MAGQRPLPALLALLLCAGARAGPLLELSVEQVEGPGFTARGLQLRMEPQASTRLRLRLTARRVDAAGTALRGVGLSCRELLLEPGGERCLGARLKLRSERYGPITASGELRRDAARGTLFLSLPRVRSRIGDTALEARWQERAWSLRARLPGLDLAPLAPLAAAGLSLAELRGRFSGSLRLSGEGTAPRQAEVEGEFRDLSFNGRNVAEALAGRVRARLDLDPAGAAGGLELHLAGGALYLEPGFTLEGIAPGFTLEPQEGGITLRAEGRWQREERRLELQHLVLDDAATGRIEARLALLLGPAPELQSLQLESERVSLPPLYRDYLQPLLLNTLFGDLEIAGSTSVRIDYRDGRLVSLDLSPAGVYLEDQGGRFALAALQGELHLRGEGQAPPSRLQWQGLSLYRLDFGPAQLPFQGTAGGLRLLNPARIPLLDGALRLQSLQLSGLFTPAFSLQMDAALEPVSLQDLCHALGWPVFPGTLGGEVPGLRYAHGDLSIAGTLVAQAFDGRIEIRGLKIHGLFDPVPELSADIYFHHLDLELLTATFAFGEIEGRLDGAIENLRLQAWEPVSFDAWFATPEDYRGRRRISQKAVENLTRLGGGMSANLISRQLLGLFETFSYDRIGLRCRLRNGVCRMDGVMPAAKGYYILRHGLLPPWIDIIGYNREVDWVLLVDRLRAIAQGAGPVIR